MNIGSRIESIGVYIPERIMTTSSIVDRLKLPGSLKLELMTGISERRVCSETEDSLVLALEATKDCLKHSSIKSEDVEMIIFCAISRYVDGLKYVFEPAFSLMLKEKLGMDRAIVFDISNACAGMLTGMHIGTDFIERGEGDAVEFCIRIGHRRDNIYHSKFNRSVWGRSFIGLQLPAISYVVVICMPVQWRSNVA